MMGQVYFPQRMVLGVQVALAGAAKAQAGQAKTGSAQGAEAVNHAPAALPAGALSAAGGGTPVSNP